MTAGRNPFVSIATRLLPGVVALLGAAPAGALEGAVMPPLAAACQACHGREGISESGDFPNLAGQKKEYLVRQLEAFRSGQRKNDFMAAIAGQLGDADIGALALFWSQKPGAGTAASTPATALAVRSRMAFPTAFPTGFTLYETVADEGQVARRYANDVALHAAREGKPLPSGAVIVVANHVAQLDASQKPVLDGDGRAIAGKLLSYAAMESHSGWGDDVPTLLRNGDWDYALFNAAGVRRDAVNQAGCLACHKPIAADSYVFTMKALRAVAARPPG
ncbi:MAG: cytochrome P460 family protein [Caldimonas sp.]